MNFHQHIGTPDMALVNDDDDSILENNKRSGPGVVARLMGMDPLPPEKGTTIHVKEYFEKNQTKHISRVPRFVSTKTDLGTFSSTAFHLSKEESSLSSNKQNSSTSTKIPIMVKPHRREHPQEELLQKFKKEFESWQASKLLQCSNNLDQNDSSKGLKNEKCVPLEDLNMDKIAGCANSRRRCHTQTNPIEADVHIKENKIKIAPIDGYHHEGNSNKQCVPRTEDDTGMIRNLPANTSGPISRGNIQEKRSRSCSPTRIVILKPSSDISEVEETRGGSSEARMEHFLEKVKKKLQLEIEGKGRTDSIRTNVANMSLHERSNDPKQLARDIATHIRESVTKEVGSTSSVMPDSMRTYRNDFHPDELESSEFIKRDTRKFISDRLKNALKDDTKLEKHFLNDGRAGNSLWIKEKERSKPITDYYSKEGKGASFWEDKKAVNESIPKYLRVKMTAYDADTISPPNLANSFFAPVSGATFGKLPLEDCHVKTGGQICHKQEDSEIYSQAINKNKKDGFNFKGRVSNLRRNLNFKGRIFGKKMSSMGESTAETFSYDKPIETVPSVIRNFGMVQDNDTEVPPTPAPLSSSPSTENSSPVSPLEVPFVVDNSSTQVQGELGFTLPDDTSKESKEVVTEPQFCVHDESLHIEGHAKSYIRDILVVSGLYTTVLSEGRSESISSCIFDEVEDKLFKSGNFVGDCCKLGDTKIDRKLLFDLVNESLPGVLKAYTTQSKRWTQGPSQLVDELLHRIQIYTDPKVDQPQFVEKMSCDIKLTVCFTAPDDEINCIVNEVEGLLIRDLIDEFLFDALVL